MREGKRLLETWQKKSGVPLPAPVELMAQPLADVGHPYTA
jgi:hypothetical protein